MALKLETREEARGLRYQSHRSGLVSPSTLGVNADRRSHNVSEFRSRPGLRRAFDIHPRGNHVGLDASVLTSRNSAADQDYEGARSARHS